MFKAKGIEPRRREVHEESLFCFFFVVLRGFVVNFHSFLGLRAPPKAEPALCSLWLNFESFRVY